MTSELRETYLDAADVATSLLSEGEVGARWQDASVLPDMTVGALAAHLARSVVQVEWFLDAPLSGRARTDAVDYYAHLEHTAVPDSPLNIGVRQRSEDTARDGHTVVAQSARDALSRLRPRLGLEPSDRRVAVAHRAGEEILLDDYLRTRCVELAVHTEDLALSLGRSVRAPGRAVAVAVELLFAASRRRHGDGAVLQALARRERDVREVLRVL